MAVVRLAYSQYRARERFIKVEKVQTKIQGKILETLVARGSFFCFEDIVLIEEVQLWCEGGNRRQTVDNCEGCGG